MMIQRFAWCVSLGFPLCVSAQKVEPLILQPGFGKPALIATAELAEFTSLPEDRRKLIAAAIALAKDSPWLPYTQRGSSPADGGFDCSGAMYFVMRGAGLDPPRTAAAQFLWLKRNGRLHGTPATAVDAANPEMKELRPGDLLFWGRSGVQDAGGLMDVTHVAMYLGTEKRDKRPVMINSTNGRSYRGIKANGYGVYDFRLPLAEARIAFIGYGTPPGIATTSNGRKSPAGSPQVTPPP